MTCATWKDGVFEVPARTSGVGRRNGARRSRLGCEGGGAEYKENESGKE